MALDKRDGDIDSILQELREKTDASAPVSDAKLNEIMSELGYGETPGGNPLSAPIKPPPQKQHPPRPAMQKETKEKQAAPAPAPKRETPPKQEKPRSKKQGTGIWDIEVENGPAEYRTGKAAALDLVEPGKYANDEELARWFEGGGNVAMDKKEQHRLDKERKRQEAEERKREKRQGRISAPNDDKYYDEAPGGGYNEDAYGAKGQPVSHEDDYETPPYGDAEYEDVRPERPKNADDPRRFFTLEDIDSDGRPRGAGELADGAFFVTEDGPVKLQWDPNPPAPRAPSPPQENFERGYEQDADGYYTRKEVDMPSATPADRDVPPEENVLTGSAFETPWETSWPEQDNLMGEDEHRGPHGTMVFEAQRGEGSFRRVPTSAFTQEFTLAEGWEPTHPDGVPRNLYVDEKVDDRFREFFSETVSVQEDEIEHGVKKTEHRARRKRRRQFTTGEFAKLGEEAEERNAFPMDEDDDEYEEYNRPQDAPAIEGSIFALLRSLRIRFFATLGLAVLLLWMSLGAADVLPLPGFVSPGRGPMGFAVIYLVLVLGAVGLNFATVAPGLVGLAAEPTVDSSPALAGLGALLQAVVVLVQMLTKSPLDATLFGGMAALILAVNALGKQIRAGSILDNFQLASAGAVHSAAYVLDTRYDEAYDLTRGLEEDHPALLISRPTSLMKGFMRQSFSPRRSDFIGRILAWVLFGAGLLVAIIAYVKTQQLFTAVSAFAAALCLGSPLTSSLVSGLPSMLMQRGASRVGAVVPGWSAIEELGGVNVVMAGGRDLFPPSALRLHGLRAFEMQNINSAILYAASILVQGCDTLREIFLALVNSRADTLYKTESLIYEPGRGYTAWVDDKRIVLGNREMMQKHDITLPSIELEMRYVQERDRRPLYLAVSGRLYAMFVVGYSLNEEVQMTLDSLVNSGVSLLVDSNDMNISDELIENVYDLPRGFVKVLGVRELERLEPLTSYLDESEGVMSHAGAFASFIGGMRAAASCALAERMGSILQMISVGFCCLLALALAFAGGLSGLSLFPLLLCHLAFSIVALAIPFGQKY